MIPRSSRRSVLAALGTAALSGCTAVGEPTADDPPEPGVDTAPSPDGHVHGGDGNWSSFGCNAGNTREVGDGRAPTDGVSERWRVEVPQLAFREPVVADGRVYFADGDLTVYDAADGAVLWSRPGIEDPPLVRDGTVYVPARDRLLALEAATGEPIWERTLEAAGLVGAPSTYAGDWLLVPVGETIYRLEAETGETDWSRRLFGRILDSPPIWGGYGIVLATEAGKLSVLADDGAGVGEWDLPSTPQASPTVDLDGIYVNCRDGRTYGIGLEDTSRRTVDWDVQTGWADGGLALETRVYAGGTGGLRAIDPDGGERVWSFDTGNWRHTAPAIGRDTLFVGGDALYALDPTPQAGRFDGDGPAVRFEESFHGRVGPGPVLDDGVLYAVARTDEASYHLLALE